MSLKEYENVPVPQIVEKKEPTAAELAAEREAQLREELKQKEIDAARAQAKAEAMERYVSEQFAHGRETRPADRDTQRAVNELGLTEEDILNDPAGAIAKISAHMKARDAEMYAYQERVNSVVGNLAKNSFRAEMSALKNERFAEWLVPYVEDYFRKNPDEALLDGSVKRVYNQLVGQNYEELERLSKEKGIPPNTRQRIVEPGIRTSGYEPAPVKEEKPVLPEDEMFMLQEHNRKVDPKYKMTPEEWADIRSGKKYPKKISTDIQVRGAKSNVSY